MREIKIRGYAVDEMVNDQWMYGTGIHTIVFTDEYAKATGVKEEWFIFAESGWVQVEPKSIGQYTVLKDKNNTEIFLDDIAKREFDIWKTDYDFDGSPCGEECIDEGYFIGVVSQTPSGLYVLNKCRKYDAEGNFVKKCSGVKLHSHRCEVIGNIYDHPHLLEIAQ